MKPFFSTDNAIIEVGAKIGSDTQIWNFSHICSQAQIGSSCKIGQNVFIDNGVKIGDYCKIQNNVNIYYGVILEDYVFCGPSMTFTNVKIPRCKYPRIKGDSYYLPTKVKYGASIGAHAVIVCGITIGNNAMIGAGAVVTHSCQDHALLVGNPAIQIGWACECGFKLNELLICEDCGKKYSMYKGRLVEV